MSTFYGTKAREQELKQVRRELNNKSEPVREGRQMRPDEAGEGVEMDENYFAQPVSEDKVSEEYLEWANLERIRLASLRRLKSLTPEQRVYVDNQILNPIMRHTFLKPSDHTTEEMWYRLPVQEQKDIIERVTKKGGRKSRKKKKKKNKKKKTMRRRK
jgi:hypothetical protein